MKITLVMTLDVTYEVEEVTETLVEELSENLSMVRYLAIREGMFTADTLAELDSCVCSISREELYRGY